MKKYENFINKPLYNIGDYVYFWHQVSKKTIVSGKVKILEIEYIDSLNIYQYLVTDGISEDRPIGQTGSLISADRYITDRLIKRLLNPYEIVEFESKSKSKKYNL